MAISIGVGTRCARCISDTRDMYQYHFDGQSAANTQQAIYNDREGAMCGNQYHVRERDMSTFPGRNHPKSCGVTKYYPTFSPKTKDDVANCCREKLLSGRLATNTTVTDPALLPVLPVRAPVGTHPKDAPPKFHWK